MAPTEMQQRWENAIQSAYEARMRRYPGDAPLGWRLLYSPCRVLNGAKVAFIGLNPGGSLVNPAHGIFSCEGGSAYRKEIEDWGKDSALQDQVLAVFRRLRVVPEDVLAGNLVPFRSPGEDSLRDAESAISFGTRLWSEILAQARPSVVVTMGKKANQAVSGLLGVRNRENHPVEWKPNIASRGTFPGGTWIGLPHLSRFKIMNRPISQPALDRVFRGLEG